MGWVASQSTDFMSAEAVSKHTSNSTHDCPTSRDTILNHRGAARQSLTLKIGLIMPKYNGCWQAIDMSGAGGTLPLMQLVRDYVR